MAYKVVIKNLSFIPPNSSSKGVLKDVNFSVEEGEFVSLIGLNGQGKTSIIKAIAGELNNNFVNGEVFVGTAQIDRPIYEKISGVGIVHQFVQDDLIEQLSILKNLQIRQLFSNDKDARDAVTLPNWEANTNQFLSKYIKNKNFTVNLNTLVEKLSGGQKQILNVLMSVELEHSKEGCHLLLLDEHLTGLDIVVREAVMKLINDLTMKSNGQNIYRNSTIIMVTHDLELALRHSDKIVIVRNGTISNTDVFIKNNHSEWTKSHLQKCLESE